MREFLEALKDEALFVVLAALTVAAFFYAADLQEQQRLQNQKSPANLVIHD